MYICQLRSLLRPSPLNRHDKCANIKMWTNACVIAELQTSAHDLCPCELPSQLALEKRETSTLFFHVDTFKEMPTEPAWKMSKWEMLMSDVSCHLIVISYFFRECPAAWLISTTQLSQDRYCEQRRRVSQAQTLKLNTAKMRRSSFFCLLVLLNIRNYSESLQNVCCSLLP